jgi:hypothetical protein
LNEFMPHFAPFVVLGFLGTLFLLGVGALILFYGAVRRSSLLAVLGSVACAALLSGYGLFLGGASLFSRERILPPGGWKYFCEIDCHIAYSIAGVQSAASLGPELQPVAARGRFVLVQVKTWFDENTISSHRGNGLLTPNPRRVLLVDDEGHAISTSPEGEAALTRAGAITTPLSQPLRPGESYTTKFVFDVPANAQGLRLFITDADWISHLLLGHENSPLHAKVYLGLEPGLRSDTASPLGIP